jgi:hypothetical protein
MTHFRYNMEHWSGSLTTITIWEWGMMIPNAAAAVRRIRGFECEIK